MKSDKFALHGNLKHNLELVYIYMGASGGKRLSNMCSTHQAFVSQLVDQNLTTI